MSWEFELSRRKILGAVGGVGLASAGAGMGTTAFLNDTESFEGNSMTAGELDLRIDWQQTYHGPPSGDVYGTGGYPYVNAHPDHDEDGIQSLNSTEFSSVPDDGEVTYEDGNDNIQEYLTCETLDNFEVPDDFYNGNRTQDHLVELSDVKPGDRGEITFSFHLCDNPGYVWFTGGGFSADEGGTNEPESGADGEEDGVVELADKIIVRPWYDIDCDNVFEPGEGEDVIVDSPTTLRKLFEDRLTAQGRLLNPGVYSSSSSGEIIEDQECNFLGKIEWNSGGLSVETDDTGVDGEVVYSDTTGPDFKFVVRIEDTIANVEVHFLIDSFTFSGGVSGGNYGDFSEVTMFDWEVLDDQSVDGTTYYSDVEGMCRLDIKSGSADDTTNDLVIGGACTEGQEGVVSPEMNDQGNLKGISNTQFYYCPPGGGGSTETGTCFPAGETFCVGFEWILPANVGNEVQTDSVSFDLGFYTEQCRHNDSPTGPTSS